MRLEIMVVSINPSLAFIANFGLLEFSFLSYNLLSFKIQLYVNTKAWSKYTYFKHIKVFITNVWIGYLVNSRIPCGTNG